MSTPLSFLADATFFRGLGDASRRALAAIAAYRTLRKGETLFREGMPGTAVMTCHAGRIQLHKTAPDGAEVVIKVVQPPETFAEAILFEADRYPVTATALTAAEVVVLPRAGLHALLDRPDFRNDFMAMLMRKQRYLAQRLMEVTSQPAEERLLAFVREQAGSGPSASIPVSKKSAAAAIGITPEHLSRLLRDLERRRVLRWRGRAVTWGKPAAP